MDTLNQYQVEQALASLHQKADENQQVRMKEVSRLIGEKAKRDYFEQVSANGYMSVSAEEGRFLHFLAKISKAKCLVEFGCSFGISTIYLAAAARDNGGRVITTEMEAGKWQPALDNIATAGLSEVVTLLRGNALETLNSVDQKIDFLFLDGAKELYLPVFKLLEPRLQPQAIIFADNADNPGTKTFLDHITGRPDEFNTYSAFGNRAFIAYQN